MFVTVSPFSSLPQERQDLIIFEARTQGASVIAKKYAEEAKMKPESLYALLKRRITPVVKENEKEGGNVGNTKKVPKEKKLKKLSSEEVEMLKGLEAGTTGIEEMSRVVAARVFKRMLQNPDDFKFIDFFRAELLRQKEQETKLKYKWTNELMARMFAGQLPPKVCPSCGLHLVKEITEGDAEAIDGEVLE